VVFSFFFKSQGEPRESPGRRPGKRAEITQDLMKLASPSGRLLINNNRAEIIIYQPPEKKRPKSFKT
jgi:hypothetical protein